MKISSLAKLKALLDSGIRAAQEGKEVVLEHLDRMAEGVVTNSQSNFKMRSVHDRYELLLALPGFNKSEVSIEWLDDILTVTAENEENLVCESLQTDNSFDIRTAKAYMENGLLRISIGMNNGGPISIVIH